MGCAASRADDDFNGVWVDVGAKRPRLKVETAGARICDCIFGGWFEGSREDFEPPTLLD